jgi:hypothetical protein
MDWIRHSAWPIAANLVVVSLACAGAWLGYVAVTSFDERALQTFPPGGRLGLLWYLPAAYLAAWSVLTLRSAVLAFCVPVGVCALCLATFYVTWIAGLFSFGLLVLPVSRVLVVVIALALWRVQRADAEDGGSTASAAAHVAMLLPALFVMVGATGQLPDDGSEVSWRNLVTAGTDVGLGFALHAVDTWTAKSQAAQRPIRWGRAAMLIVVAWGFPTAMVARQRSLEAASAWPANVVTLANERYWVRYSNRLCLMAIIEATGIRAAPTRRATRRASRSRDNGWRSRCARVGSPAGNAPSMVSVATPPSC